MSTTLNKKMIYLLDMSKLIRKIIKESIDEFDWVDLNTSDFSGEKLHNMIQELFALHNDYYWIEKKGGIYDIWDNTGIYVEFNELDFTVSRLREDLLVTIKDTDMDYEIREEYFQLAKTLEPIIGPIGKDIYSIN